MARTKGNNTVTLIGQQVDKSTLQTIVTKVLAKNNTLEAGADKIQSEALDGNSFVKEGAVVAYDIAGDINMEFTTDSLEAVLPFAGFTKTVNDWSLGSTIPEYASIYCQLTDATEERQFLGCKMDTLEIDMAQKSYVALNTNWKGLNYAYQAALTSPTVTAVSGPRAITTDTNITVTIGGTDRTAIIKSLKLSVASNIEIDDVLGQVEGEDLDSTTIEVRMSCTAIFDKTVHQAMKADLFAGTKMAASFSVNDKVTVNLYNCEVDSVNATIDGPDTVEMNFDLIALYDNTEQTPIKITVLP